MDIETYALLSGKVSGVESMVTSLAEGFDYKGSKSSVSALPDDADAGDLYTVDGKKYVWDGTAWVELKDSVELDATLSTQGKAADAKAVGDALVTDTTLAVSGKAADAKKTGDEVSALKTATVQKHIIHSYNNLIRKSAITGTYPTITGGLSASNISDGMFEVDGTATANYPNIIFNYSIVTNHRYLFASTMKEITDNAQQWNIACRYANTSTSVTREVISGIPYAFDQVSSKTTFERYACTFTPTNADYSSADFTISAALNTSNKQASIAIKDVVLCDVTGLSDDEIKSIVNLGYFDVDEETENLADNLTNDGVENVYEAIKQNLIVNYWKGKKILVIGDSTSNANKWQQKLVSNLGAVVTTHASGGISLLQMVVGTGDLEPLYIEDVYDKDLIIIFGGFNNRNDLQGNVGDLYKQDGTGQSTVAGYLQFVLNWIYNKLSGGTDESGTYSENLSCKIFVIPPYCCGKYSYIDADGYTEYPNGSGQTLQTMGQIMIDVAHANNCSAWNSWENSGIGRNTWSIWTVSPTPNRTPDGTETAPYPQNADQVHLNDAGYAHFGECVSAVLSGIR